MKQVFFPVLVMAAAATVVACGRDGTPPAAEPGSAAGVQGRLAANVDAARLANAASDADNWMTHGRTYAEERYSPLDQINENNVDRLGLAWYWKGGSTMGTEATPLVVDGVLYSTSTWNLLHAIDAATGEELWTYDPKLDRDWIRYTCCGTANRGVAVWEGRVYFGTIDGRLVAVDAATGRPNPIRSPGRHAS
jgi:quinohemoprotein ethanol dehydrogenase